MADNSGKQRGQWVFRNQRWHYLAVDPADEYFEPAVIDPPGLLALVDIGELLGVLRVGQRLFPQPFLLSVADNVSGDEGQAKLRSLEPVWPDWWREIEALLPGVTGRVGREMEMVSGTVVALGGAERGNSLLCSGGLYCLPITVTVASNSYLLAAVTVLAAALDRLPTASVLAEAYSIPLQTAEQAYSLLTTHVESAVRADAYRAFLDTMVRMHSERLQSAAERRQELAVEQARSRHLLLRAESLERQLLRGSTEVDRVSEASGIFTRELAAILDNPQIGVTIEDTDHLVRYQNPMLRRAFGNKLGRKCYEAFKGRTEPCRPCPIQLIWEEGRESVRYTTLDQRTQRSFEVIAFPLVGERGEKQVVEVGVEVTVLVQGQQLLEKRLERSHERVGQLHALLNELGSVLQGTCRGVEDLLGSRDAAAGVASLQSRAGATASLAAALSLPLGSGPADAPRILREVLEQMGDKDHGMPSVRMPVMPDIPASAPLLQALFEGLVRHLIASLEEPYPDLDFSHTMSGSSAAISPGDSYHLLSLGPRRASAEFAEDEVSTLPAFGGEPDATMMDPDVHLAQASLVARKLGGILWRQLHAAGAVTYLLSLPVEPAE